MTSPQATWPPNDEQLGWRPEPYVYDDVVTAAALVVKDGVLPDWLLERDVAADDEIACADLVWIVLESTLGDSIVVRAIPHRDGGYQVVVTDENASSFSPPVTRGDQPLTLGQVQAVLDETQGGGTPDGGGIGHVWRDYNLVDGVTRAELVEFVSIGSTRYPQLEALDDARAALWAQEVTPEA